MACDASVVHWHEGKDSEPLNIGRKSGLFHRPYGAHSSAGMAVAVSRAVPAANSSTPTTSSTGLMVVKPAWITWCFFAEDIIAWCMKVVSVCKPGQMEKSTSLIPMEELLPPSPDGPFRGNAESIRVDNHNNGLEITHETLPPLWRGEVMDQDLAQLGMQSLE